MTDENDSARFDSQVTIECFGESCCSCRHKLSAGCDNFRTVITLKGTLHLRLKTRRCGNKSCRWFGKSYHPEIEGRLALPYINYGLDILAWVGGLNRYRHLNATQIHRYLTERKVPISRRTVANLLGAYGKLLSCSAEEYSRRRRGLLLPGQLVPERPPRQLVPDIFSITTAWGLPELLLVRNSVSGKFVLAREIDVKNVRRRGPFYRLERDRLVTEIISGFGESFPFVDDTDVTFGRRHLSKPVRAFYPLAYYSPTVLHG